MANFSLKNKRTRDRQLSVYNFPETETQEQKPTAATNIGRKTLHWNYKWLEAQCRLAGKLNVGLQKGCPAPHTLSTHQSGCCMITRLQLKKFKALRPQLMNLQKKCIDNNCDKNKNKREALACYTTTTKKQSTDNLKPHTKGQCVSILHFLL